MITASFVMQVIVCVFLLLAIHEIGHMIAAKIMGLYIQKVGITMTPYPHFFVKVDWPRKKKERTIFLLSGFFTILMITGIIVLLGISFKPLLIAIGIQFIIETNPIYSDFVIISMVDKVSLEVRKTRRPFKEVYKKMYNNYMFSKGWYFHFFIWSMIILATASILKNLSA